MFTIRCTGKLLKRIGHKPGLPAPAVESSTALGDWHANILFFHRAQALLFTSDTSRLAVVAPARDARNLGRHLTIALAELLEHLAIPLEWIQAEVSEMAELGIAPTRSRSVLATMNDYAFQIEVRFHQWGGFFPLQMSLDLSGCPSGPLGYQRPYEVTEALLRERYRPE